MEKVIERLKQNHRYSKKNNYKFSSYDYMTKKMKQLHKFFGKSGVDCVVVGISGGIDSAVVLGILDKYMEYPGSHLKKIVPIIAPFKDTVGATGQKEAQDIAVHMVKAFGFQDNEYIVRDLTKVKEAMVINFSEYEDPWVQGQMVSILRTPLFYYVAANEQKLGFKSVVAGTTNKSEGSYIGFYGKASDGMNDIQIISDLYKSEVYQLAKDLKINGYILKRSPVGDVHDGKTDEELMGFSYQELEAFLLYKEYFQDNDVREMKRYFQDVEGEDASTLDLSFIDRIEELHQKNKHKYQVGMPCHFFNVFGFGIKGGWKNKYYNGKTL